MHRMFIKRYGLLYEQNSELFLDLFHDMKAYFKTGFVDVSDAMDMFFETLFQRVFVLFNTQYMFDEAYEDCVAENVEVVAPFGDIPRRLAGQVKRSFVAARMFVRALAFGRDVMADMMRKVCILYVSISVIVIDIVHCIYLCELLHLRTILSVDGSVGSASSYGSVVSCVICSVSVACVAT